MLVPRDDRCLGINYDIPLAYLLHDLAARFDGDAMDGRPSKSGFLLLFGIPQTSTAVSQPHLTSKLPSSPCGTVSRLMIAWKSNLTRGHVLKQSPPLYLSDQVFGASVPMNLRYDHGQDIHPSCLLRRALDCSKVALMSKCQLQLLLLVPLSFEANSRP